VKGVTDSQPMLGAQTQQAVNAKGKFEFDQHQLALSCKIWRHNFVATPLAPVTSTTWSARLRASRLESAAKVSPTGLPHRVLVKS
jgi:hypothetical protein